MKPHTEELPDLPFDPSSISDSELMTMFSTYVSWQNYLDLQLAEVEFVAENVETAYEEIKGKAWGALGGTATDKRVTVEAVPRVVSAKTKLAEANKSVGLVKKELFVAERGANLLSRELSRRIGRDHTNRRENKWGAN